MSIPQHLLETLRKETPGTEHVTHLNNAGASLLSSPVYEAVKSYEKHELITGGYEAALDYDSELEATYDSVGRLIGADREEIALAENATYAWHQAFHSWTWKKGDNVVTSHTEYATNFISLLQIKEQYGVEIRIAEGAEDGSASPENIRRLIDASTKMIVLTHIPTNSGLVNPAEEIGKIAEEAGVIYLLDACQSVGQYPVDVKALRCDMLSATGRKFLRAPRGTGFLYVKKERIRELKPKFLDLHGAEWTSDSEYKVRKDARKFENWESNKALTLGLKAAADYAMSIGMDNIWNRIKSLAGDFRSRLEQEVHGLTIHDTGEVKGGIITFTMENSDCEAIKQYLSSRKINVSVSHKSSTYLDMNKRSLKAVVRASVHYYNNETDLEKLIMGLIQFQKA
ncbi:MAG: aminotransferase class V-fold PLP-dependent enzyme [Cyclobacteriaceae bacterium]